MCSHSLLHLRQEEQHVSKDGMEQILMELIKHLYLLEMYDTIF